MSNAYKIEMGSYREDFNIYYSEQNPDRKLVAAVTVKNKLLIKSQVILYLNTFKKWDVNGNDLTIEEYMIVLKRIFDFLTSKGFKINLEIDENIWPKDLESVVEMLKGNATLNAD
ncbi:MAG: hypothetical protein ACKO96_04700 [Flammeovirgaceae bacterium]